MRAPRIALFASMSLLLAFECTGCKNAQNAQVENPSQDPAAANLVPVSTTADNNAASNTGYEQADRPAPQPQRAARQPYADDQPRNQGADDAQYASGDNYNNSAPDNSNSYNDATYNGDYNNYDTPVAYAPEPPPQLPVYQQPPCPGDDYMWTPGYWNYDNGEGYYWVPGAWVLAPYTGALWTPGWWGYDRGRYGWHRGFWGRHIGYYGGINYGHGYDGRGYEGGYWRGDHFDYNRTVNNINTTVVRNVYNYQVTNINNTRISYNGGHGGIGIRPRPPELAALREQHNPPMTAQTREAQQARSDRQSFVRFNNGRPALPVVTHPLAADPGVKPPAQVNYQPRQERPKEPARSENPQPPVQFHNTIHPVPAAPHVLEERPPAHGAPVKPGNTAPSEQLNRPQEPRNNHQPAPGRPEMQRPMPAAPQQPQPQAPPRIEQPQATHPAPAPSPMRPLPPQHLCRASASCAHTCSRAPGSSAAAAR